MTGEKIIKPMGILASIVFFGTPGIFLYITINIFVPYFSLVSRWPIITSWFFCGGAFVFAPLLIFSWVFYQKEKQANNLMTVWERFRIIKIKKGDLLWGLAGLIAIMLLTMITISLAVKLMPGFTPRPLIMKMEQVNKVDMGMLAVWLPSFFFNVVGEEFFWRGYIFPRQELVFGAKTWLINGICWLAFHIPFGISVVITFIPALLIICWVVQRTKSTTIGILMHGIVNGMAFLMIALGIL